MTSPSGSGSTSYRSKFLRLRLDVDSGKQEVKRSHVHLELDSDLWENLPDDLLDEILAMAKLPFSSLVRRERKCSICRKWRDSQMFPSCTSRHKCLVFYRWDLYSGFVCSFSSRPGVWDTLRVKFRGCFPSGVVASSGGAGLLCFYTSHQITFIVCNPVTRRSKKLQVPCRFTASNCDHRPYMPNISNLQLSGRPFLAGMAVDSYTGHYKLIVAGVYPGSGGTTLVYNSCIEKWKKVASIPAVDFDYFGHGILKDIQTIECDHSFYFYGNRGARDAQHPHVQDKILKYNVQRESWSSITMPEYGGFPRNAIEHNGKLLWVTSSNRISCPGTDPTIFQTFELQEGPTRWLPTDCLPLSRIHEEVPDMRSIQCLGYGEVIFFIKRWLPSNEGPPLNLRYGRHVDCSQKTSVRRWFHNSETNSDFFSDNWETCMGGDGVYGCHIFTPSTLEVVSKRKLLLSTWEILGSGFS